MENISLSISKLNKATVSTAYPIQEEMIGLKEVISIIIEVPSGKISIKPNKEGNGIVIVADMMLTVHPEAANSINLEIK